MVTLAAWQLVGLMAAGGFFTVGTLLWWLGSLVEHRTHDHFEGCFAKLVALAAATAGAILLFLVIQ